MRKFLLLAVASSHCWAQFQAERKFIYPPEFKAGRPYSPGVLAGKTLYIAGQVDKDPQTGAQPEGIAAQTRMAMANVGHVLRAAGLAYGNVVSCHVQLAEMSQVREMDEVWASYFGPGHAPARTTLEFAALPGGAGIEISCIAYAGKTGIDAVWAGDTLYLSGTGGTGGSVESQTKQAMDNIGQVLAAAGLTFKDAVFANAYFLDPGNYGKLNSVYKDYFALGTAPSRASFCVSKLAGPGSVEFTFIATRDRQKKGRVVPDSAGPSPTSSNGGVMDGDTLYTSGKSGSGATLEAQMRDSLDSIKNILRLAGMDLSHVVDAHVYLKDAGQIDAMNAVFQEYFPRHPPARTTVQVLQQQLVQVQVVAVR